jgi:hypothetical protein
MPIRSKRAARAATACAPSKRDAGPGGGRGRRAAVNKEGDRSLIGRSFSCPGTRYCAQVHTVKRKVRAGLAQRALLRPAKRTRKPRVLEKLL